jgi:outer membrane lipoprotein-sorting protein
MKYLVCIVALIFISPLAYAERALDDVVNRLQKSYESIKTIQAKFEQTYKSRRFDEKKTKGSVAISKPGKMRWDYTEPKGRVFSSDGALITLYDPDDRQALISPQPKEGGLPVAVTFLTGKGKLRDLFSIDLAKEAQGREAEEVVLRCEPKNAEPNVREIFLTVKMGETTLVTGTRIVDALGGESEIRFSDIVVNTPLKGVEFSFKPPRGTPLVSMPTGQIKM